MKTTPRREHPSIVSIKITYLKTYQYSEHPSKPTNKHQPALRLPTLPTVAKLSTAWAPRPPHSEDATWLPRRCSLHSRAPGMPRAKRRLQGFFGWSKGRWLRNYRNFICNFNKNYYIITFYLYYTKL